MYRDTRPVFAGRVFLAIGRGTWYSFKQEISSCFGKERKAMKKTIPALLLIAAILFSLCACSDAPAQNAAPEAAKTEAQERTRLSRWE